MEKKPEPMGPPPPGSKPAGDKPPDEGPPPPGRPPHWHEGDPEPEDEATHEKQHLPPKDDVD